MQKAASKVVGFYIDLGEYLDEAQIFVVRRLRNGRYVLVDHDMDVMAPMNDGTHHNLVLASNLAEAIRQGRRSA